MQAQAPSPARRWTAEGGCPYTFMVLPLVPRQSLRIRHDKRKGEVISPAYEVLGNRPLRLGGMAGREARPTGPSHKLASYDPPHL